MKIRKAEFINYKSVKNDIIDIENDITCLVGINESGKSNVLCALEKADTKKKLEFAEFSRHSDQYIKGNETPELKLWFKPSEDEKKNLVEILGQNDITYIILRKNGVEYFLDYPKINYLNSSFSETINDQKTELSNLENFNGVEHKDEIGTENESEIRKKVIDEIIKYIPKFLHFDSVAFDEYFLPGSGEIQIDQFVANPDSSKPVKNLLTLGGIADFKDLQADNGDQRLRRDKLLGDVSRKVNDEILHVVWPVENVEVDLGADGNILKIQLREKDKTSPFKPAERSRGLQWTLAFNIFFLAETKSELNGAVLLIDEPGIFLHVNAQNKLLEQTFNRIIKNGNQIIYTTHLPYLIDPQCPERIRILEKNDENTVIGNKAWSEGEFGRIPEPIKTALGLRWAELFKVAEKNVIVEGPSDQIILRQLNSVIGNDKDINFLPAFGYEKFPATLANVKIEKKQYYGILDSDVDIVKVRKICSTISVKDDEIENLTTLVGKKDVVTIEDIVPESVFYEALFEVYKQICERKNNCNFEKDELSIAIPRIKNTEVFFANKFNSKSHKYLKMDVARMIVEILNGKNKKPSEIEFENAKRLIQAIEGKFNKNENT